jgi:hypothetical protein
MFSTKRIRLIIASASAVIMAAAGIGVGLAASASASPAGAAKPAHHPHHAPKPKAPKLSLTPFDLNGYVINTDYTLGTNTGNTFQQTYTATTVHGVPIAGPNVGVSFPVDDYVAVPISGDQLYITWLDPSTHAIVDVFVFNFKTHTVYDYAPGATPQSAGTITIVKRGASLP